MKLKCGSPAQTVRTQVKKRTEIIRPETKFPQQPHTHYAFSSWIEKTMKKTIHCHWDNRFVLQ